MSATEIKPIRTERDYEATLAEIERLWGAKANTPEAERLDVLATLIDAYETEHYPIDPPDASSTSSSRGSCEGISGD